VTQGLRPIKQVVMLGRVLSTMPAMRNDKSVWSFSCFSFPRRCDIRRNIRRDPGSQGLLNVSSSPPTVITIQPGGPQQPCGPLGQDKKCVQ